MRARIHRGATEIGGNCVELESNGKRLVLDLGRPLTADWDEEVPLPEIAGLAGQADPSLLGIVISHAHPDHYGLLAGLETEAPVFIGEAAERVLGASHFFGAAPQIPEASGYLSDSAPIELGPFRVTSFLIDHSAFDAYSIMVEAEGRRLFYSGDVRSHGRKPGTFQRLVERPPEDIHVLMLEGTRLGRQPGSEISNELGVQERTREILSSTDGLVLAMYSPQNVDRYVSLFKAARQAGREFVIDFYASQVAKATGRDTIPQADWDGVDVFVPLSQSIRVKKSGEFSAINRLRAHRIYVESLIVDPSRYLLTFRASMIRDIQNRGLGGGAAIWSMWPGYLEGERMQVLNDFLGREGIQLHLVHASGHAEVEDLKRLAAALKPERVVPIHTEAPERFGELYEHIEPHPDGEWWEV